MDVKTGKRLTMFGEFHKKGSVHACGEAAQKEEGW